MVWSYPAEANMTDIEEVVVYWMRVLLMSGVYLDKVIKNSSGEIGVSHIFRCGKKEKDIYNRKNWGFAKITFVATFKLTLQIHSITGDNIYY